MSGRILRTAQVALALLIVALLASGTAVGDTASAPGTTPRTEQAAGAAREIAAAAGLPRDGLLISPIPGLTAAWHPAPPEAAVPLGSRVRFLRALHPRISVAWSGAVEVYRDARWSLAEALLDAPGERVVAVAYTLPNGQVLTDRTVLAVVARSPEAFRVTGVRVEAEPVAEKARRGASVAEVSAVGADRWRTARGTRLRLVARTEPAGFAPLVEWRSAAGTRLELGPELAFTPARVGEHSVAAGPEGRDASVQVEAYAVRILPPPELEGRAARGEPLTFRAVTDPAGFEGDVRWTVEAAGAVVAPETGRGSTFTFALSPAGPARVTVRADDAVLTLDPAPAPIDEAFTSTARVRVTLDPGDPGCAAGFGLELTSTGLDPAVVRRAPPPYADGQVIATEMTRLELGAFSTDVGHVLIHQRADRPSVGRMEEVVTAGGQFVSGRSSFDVFVAIELPELGLAFDTGDQPVHLDAGTITALPPLGTPYRPAGGEPVPLYDAESKEPIGWLCHADHTPVATVLPPPGGTTPGTSDEDCFTSTGQATLSLSTAVFAPALKALAGETFLMDVALSSEGLAPATVLVDPPPYAPGEVIRTEMVALTLGGTAPGAGQVVLRERDDRRSFGSILVEAVDADGNLVAGEASFDLFLNLELPDQGMVLHTGMEPFHVTAGTISGLPPVGTSYEHDPDDAQETPLYDSGTFQQVGTVVASNHWPVEPKPCPCAVDLDIDSDNNNGVGLPDRSAAEDAIEENPPGKYIGLNDDDDDGNKVRDLAEEPIRPNPPEDDPVFMVLEVKPNTPPDKWTLTYPAQVQVYDMDVNPPQIIPSGQKHPAPLTPNPKNVKVEGVQTSAALGDVLMTLTYECITTDKDGYAHTEVLVDKVKATVVKVDLDVDSDNGNTTADFGPQRDQGEDDIEDHDDKPGRFVPVNADDDDNDNVADLGDGYNLNGTAGDADDANAKENDFVRMALEVPAPIDLNAATVRFTYSASDPATATAAGSPPTITPAAGRLRIWKKNGNVARNKARASQAGGDYVHTGEVYKATDLGLSTSSRTVSLWLEGIRPSVGGSDRILVEVDPDGNGPALFVAKDAVRATVFGIDVLDSGGTNATDHVQIARWDNAFQGTAAARSVKNAFQNLDVERYYVRVTDAGAGAGPITATIESYDRQADPTTAAAVDQSNAFPLTAVGNNAFRSEADVLVVNQDAIDDNFAQAPDVDGTDDGADDKTMYGVVDGKVKATYTRAGATATAVVDVCDKRPADETKNKTLRAHVLRVAVGGAAAVANSEVDEEVVLMNRGWSQCCLQFALSGAINVANPPAAEAFNDTGFDHDGNAATPNIGAGNGVFDFTDTDADNLHDQGERSETFTDANGNNGYDFVVDLSDGLDEFDTGGPLALYPTREERNLIDTYSDGNDKTIEYFVVNNLDQGSRGEAFIPSIANMANNLKKTNAMIVQAAAVGMNGATPRDFVNAAHEAGHILLNSGAHENQTTLAGRVNMMAGGGTDAADGVTNTKRLKAAQCTTGRGF